jgi:hypothetical protein
VLERSVGFVCDPVSNIFPAKRIPPPPPRCLPIGGGVSSRLAHTPRSRAQTPRPPPDPSPMAALLRAAGASRTLSKSMTQTRGYKVAVLGAAGGIGQPCGLLMKMVRRRSREPPAPPGPPPPPKRRGSGIRSRRAPETVPRDPIARKNPRGRARGAARSVGRHPPTVSPARGGSRSSVPSRRRAAARLPRDDPTPPGTSPPTESIRFDRPSLVDRPSAHALRSPPRAPLLVASRTLS